MSFTPDHDDIDGTPASTNHSGLSNKGPRTAKKETKIPPKIFVQINGGANSKRGGKQSRSRGLFLLLLSTYVPAGTYFLGARRGEARHGMSEYFSKSVFRVSTGIGFGFGGRTTVRTVLTKVAMSVEKSPTIYLKAGLSTELFVSGSPCMCLLRALFEFIPSIRSPRSLLTTIFLLIGLDTTGLRVGSGILEKSRILETLILKWPAGLAGDWF